MTEVLMVRAGAVETAYERRGDPDGWPVVLLHGFPYGCPLLRRRREQARRDWSPPGN